MKKIYPPTHFYTYLIISIAFHFLLPVKQIIFTSYAFLGFIPAIAGAILNVWSDNLFKKLNTTVKPDQKPSVLIDYGPFKISRNPMYLGMALLLIGAGILMGSVTAFIGAIFFVIAMEIYFIPDEEKLMQDAFGEKFEIYKKNVRRWI
jgi:protein-S-isoprenylcysteine O-methyltransferase Ste14